VLFKYVYNKTEPEENYFLNITCADSITDVYVDFAADNQFQCKDITSYKA
jgi:hypothetical protein